MKKLTNTIEVKDGKIVPIVKQAEKLWISILEQVIDGGDVVASLLCKIYMVLIILSRCHDN